MTALCVGIVLNSRRERVAVAVNPILSGEETPIDERNNDCMI